MFDGRFDSAFYEVFVVGKDQPNAWQAGIWINGLITVGSIGLLALSGMVLVP